MKFAEGMEAAIAQEARFADQNEAEAFWAKGTDEVPVEDHFYQGGSGQDQRLRIFRGGDETALTLLYIHGGGWAGGSIELNVPCAQGLAKISGCNVVSISYRLAPKHPYPAALNDCLAALRWIHEFGPKLHLNPVKIAVGGASAGGNLAMACALAHDPDTFVGMLLFYGVLGGDFDTKSYRQYEHGPGLTRQGMMEYFSLYDPTGEHRNTPGMVPQLAKNMAQMPPSCLIAAELDVLLDDSRNMADALRDAGVPTTFHIEPGVTHGFINRGRLVPAANAAIRRAAQFLRHLNDPEIPR